MAGCRAPGVNVLASTRLQTLIRRGGRLADGVATIAEIHVMLRGAQARPPPEDRGDGSIRRSIRRVRVVGGQGLRPEGPDIPRNDGDPIFLHFVHAPVVPDPRLQARHIVEHSQDLPRRDQLLGPKLRRLAQIDIMEHRRAAGGPAKERHRHVSRPIRRIGIAGLLLAPRSAAHAQHCGHEHETCYALTHAGPPSQLIMMARTVTARTHTRGGRHPPARLLICRTASLTPFHKAVTGPETHRFPLTAPHIIRRRPSISTEFRRIVSKSWSVRRLCGSLGSRPASPDAQWRYGL